MDPILKAEIRDIERGEDASACVYHLIDLYYQCVIGIMHDDIGDGSPSFPEELLLPVEERNSGIGDALVRLINTGHDIDEADDYFNALMLAVGAGDAPMTHFLIKHGADAKAWPGMDEDLPFENENFYLEDIDIHCMDEYFEKDTDIDCLKALYRTAVVLVEDAHLGPYCGHCMKIDENGEVSFEPPKLRY